MICASSGDAGNECWCCVCTCDDDGNGFERTVTVSNGDEGETF